MNASVVKFAPTAVVLVAAGACAWPYLGDFQQTPPPAAAPARAGPEIPAGLLKPAPVPRPAHDPFQDPEVFRSEARARVARFLSALVKPKADPRRSSKGGVKNGRPDPAGGGTPDLDPREGLTLSATSSHGLRGVAVINGHTYVTGETVRDADTPDPCVLHEVRPNLALLRYRGKTYPLAYPTHAARTTPAPSRASGPPAARDETAGATSPRRVTARRTGARKRITPDSR